MKYWIMPIIHQFTGLGLGVFFAITMFLVLDNPEYSLGKNPSLVIGLASCAIAFMAIFGDMANSHKLLHYKRIMQKAGIWTDDIIKKKDLPKKEDK